AAAERSVTCRRDGDLGASPSFAGRRHPADRARAARRIVAPRPVRGGAVRSAQWRARSGEELASRRASLIVRPRWCPDRGGPPVLLVADDVQWCDRETLQFLHYLMRSEMGARLLVAATVRREEVESEHPLNDLIAGLHVLERITELEIGRLNSDEAAMLAE